MIPVLTAAEMRALDQHTIREVGVPGPVLMETAGRGVFEHLWGSFGELARAGRVAVVCGRGNNGGDGFVVARCLANRGCPVSAYLLGRREAVQGDAAVHLSAYLGSGGHLVEVADANRRAAEVSIRQANLVVDAILGTGLSDEVRGPAAEAIAWIRAAQGPVVSVDVPSGVSSDTGRVCGDAVRARLTVTFAFPKRGHYLHPGASLVGQLEVVDIGIPPAALSEVRPAVYRLEGSDFAGCLDRPADAHKGTVGHVVVFGGTPGKTGAPGLAAWGALRSGAGLATVAWPAGLDASRLPLEVMTEPLDLPNRVPRGGNAGAFGPRCIPPLGVRGATEGLGLGLLGARPPAWGRALWEAAGGVLARADALVVGPGMGTAPGAAEFLARLLGEEGAPALLDADALNLLAQAPGLWEDRRRETILTPHPGEAARLLQTTPKEIQAGRVEAVQELAERFACAVVLKGAGTLVAEPGSPSYLVALGNPGMATAGSGDVLSGVVGALLARGLGPLEAGRLGAYVHALAGDRAVDRVGVEGLVASDILEALPAAFESVKREA